MNRAYLLPGVITGALFAAACGSSSTPAPASSSTPAAPAAASATPAPASSPAAASGAVVALATSKFGQMLVDGRGMSLYLFEADTSTKSTCFNQCAANWPPLLTTGAPTAMGGANQALLGTTPRGDGTTQVTYNGHPLYFFVSDTKPGDVTGEGVN
ncbi:MAG: hypothetical protein JOZ46_07350, partial [Candidatus Dormibacteraeota bacterium]|nr:hypothetical protein [Candidatus Dormibacteraeota bacterium]